MVSHDVKPFIHCHWSNLPPVIPMWHYLLEVIFIIFLFFSWFGNGIVLYLFSCKKSLLSPANMFVVNLALSDLMMMASPFPMYVINCFECGYWTLCALVCQVHAFTSAINGNNSAHAGCHWLRPILSHCEGLPRRS